MKDKLRPIVEARNLIKTYKIGGNAVRVLNDVSFSVLPGETLGLVGESGCGKSTLAKTMLRLEQPTAGAIFFKDVDITHHSNHELRPLRRQMQIVMQDPYSSLNPRMTAYDIVAEGLKIHHLGQRSDWKTQIESLFDLVGLAKNTLMKMPHEFSGGQRQRIGIARALAIDPDFIILDEPLSSLDAAVQVQIMSLLHRLQKERMLTFLFISHDLSAIRQLSHRIAVMYLGEIIEMAAAEDLMLNPLHPYTQALLAAIPVPDPIRERARKHVILKGDPPSLLNRPKGCPYHPCCPNAMPVCAEFKPQLKQQTAGHWSACHLGNLGTC